MHIRFSVLIFVTLTILIQGGCLGTDCIVVSTSATQQKTRCVKEVEDDVADVIIAINSSHNVAFETYEYADERGWRLPETYASGHRQPI